LKFGIVSQSSKLMAFGTMKYNKKSRMEGKGRRW
jgi:hypothetical protein